MSTDEKFKDAYRKALNIPKDKNLSSSALDRAHELRKFEIENYWRRATYFWAFQIVAFTLFGLVWQEIEPNGSISRTALLVPTALGTISAWVGWLTAKGSKFWQENWEAHVDMLEEEAEGRLTQIILSRTGPQFSVSKLNLNFMRLLTIGWLVTFIVTACPKIENCFKNYEAPIGLITLLASMAFIAINSKTSLDGRLYRPSDGGWPRYEHVSIKKRLKQFFAKKISLSEPNEPKMIRRDTFAGKADDPSAE